MTKKEYDRTKEEVYFSTMENPIWSVSKIKKLLNKTKYPKLKVTKVEYSYGKGICKDIRLPEKIANHPTLQLYCNGMDGSNMRVSSKAKKLLKKYSKRKQKQWFIKDLCSELNNLEDDISSEERNV